MRPYEELCSIASLADLRLVKALLNKHNIEYFVEGDPFDLLLLHIKNSIRVMVKYNELGKAKRLLEPLGALRNAAQEVA